MSHNSVFKTKIKNIKRFFDLLTEMNVQNKLFDKMTDVNLYGSNKVKAIGTFKPKGWHYDVAVNEAGEMTYDFFGSRSGSFNHLGEIIREHNKAEIAREIDYTMVSNCQFIEEVDVETKEKQTRIEIYYN